MRALVFGETGQVARELARTATARGISATFLGRDRADLSDPAACAAVVRAAEADVILNAAAYTAVDKAEDEPELAHAINAAAPGAMAAAAAAKGVPFLHVSTDYVFDGAPGRPWREDDPTGPLGVYGASKLAGERAVAAAAPDHAILRTAWVFSAHGKNFVKTMLGVGRGKPEMRVVGDQRGGPTAASDIAAALWTMAGAWTAGEGRPGIFHFAGAPAVSWAEFAEAIFARSGLGGAAEGDRDRHRRLADESGTAGELGARLREDHLRLRHRPAGLAAGARCGHRRAGGGGSVSAARKGIILAGGSGTRLYPITHSLSKQLLPLYDKPMIYYPLSVLMLAGLREIAIITTPEDQDQFRRLLRDGAQWGMRFEYIAQPKPEGLAQAYLLAEAFLDGTASTMVLGDNIFFGHDLPLMLQRAGERPAGGTVFGYKVADPERYGVVAFDRDGRVLSIEEKPETPKSDFAVTGIYVLDGSAPTRAHAVRPSARGELEITELLNSYLADGLLNVERMGRGFAWLDTGTHASLLDAGNFVRTIEERQNVKIGCPEEIAFLEGWISVDVLKDLAAPYLKTEYGRYLLRVADGG